MTPLEWTAPPDTIEPYRRLLGELVERDERCPSPMCPVTMLGHMLDGLPQELVDLVRAEDPSQPNFPGE